MNNFKVGDKVETPYGMGIIKDIGTSAFIYIWYEVYLDTKKPDIIYLHKSVIKPYKSAHDKLLELGWEMKLSDDIYYEKFNEKTRRTMIIRIPKDIEGWFVNLINTVIDLELSKILTQYLEELEKENEQ